MFMETTIWNPAIMTVGSIVELTGWSGYNDFKFKGKHYKVIATKLDMLEVQSRNGKKYEIYVWEVDDDPDYGVHVKIIEQAPVETVEMPF